MPYQITCA
jgi:hypothetical protein